MELNDSDEDEEANDAKQEVKDEDSDDEVGV